jgi:RNA polymerase sigma-70 factor (ECF subfamily)
MLTTEKVWEEFSNGLRQFILKRVPDESQAEDVLQDVFLKIHTRINTLRDQERLPAWVYQIARNTVYDFYRAQKVNLPLPLIPVMPHSPEYVSEDVVAELAPCVKEMVESLPTDYRDALILTEYEGLTQKELSEKLGLSFSGAKSRVQRARGKIRQMLLDCCHFEFDHAGRIIDYQPRCACCSNVAANE